MNQVELEKLFEVYNCSNKEELAWIVAAAAKSELYIFNKDLLDKVAFLEESYEDAYGQLVYVQRKNLELTHNLNVSEEDVHNLLAINSTLELENKNLATASEFLSEQNTIFDRQADSLFSELTAAKEKLDIAADLNDELEYEISELKNIINDLKDIVKLRDAKIKSLESLYSSKEYVKTNLLQENEALKKGFEEISILVREVYDEATPVYRTSRA